MNRFENGFDSFKKAIWMLDKRNEDEYALKDIIINFHHSIEVLFKHVLYNRDKCLIYREMDGWINRNFEIRMGSGNVLDDQTYYTINFDETIRRVIVLFDIPIDRYTYDGFRNLNKLRNSLTHDEVKLNKNEVEQIFVSLITIVTDILRNYLPETEKVKFNKFVDSKEYIGILNKLTKYNIQWRIITIASLLKLYFEKDFDSLTQTQITNILKTLSSLGIYICEEYGLFLEIDGEYYISHMSYLKQEICDLLLRCGVEGISNQDVLMAIKNSVIEKIVEEYLKKATLYTYQLIGDVDNSFFENTVEIDKFLRNNSIVNNNDIYVVLQCINQIAEVSVVISGERRRENLLKKIYLDEQKSLSVQTFYSGLITWFNNNGWYNKLNFDKLESHEKIILEVDAKNPSAHISLDSKIEQEIYNNELYQELIGEMGEWGTIDNIDEVYIEELQTVIKNDDTYTLIFYVSFGTQTYFDHEYFSNGSEECLIKADGVISNNEFQINRMDYIGHAVGFHNFKFD